MSPASPQSAERILIVRSADAARVAAYLPDNYRAVGVTDDGRTIVAGHDSAGWTLEDYVIPRLLSACIASEEVTGLWQA